MNPRLSLKPLDPEDLSLVMPLLKALPADENSFQNTAFGLNEKELKAWLVEQHAWSLGENLPKGYVKQWTYWLMLDDEPVGYGKLRERATEQSKRNGGNIGLAVHPLHRGLGYGGKLFALLLEEAKKLGIPEIYSTVRKGNIPSHKVHLKHGFKVWDEDEDWWYYHFSLG